MAYTVQKSLDIEVVVGGLVSKLLFQILLVIDIRYTFQSPLLVSRSYN